MATLAICIVFFPVVLLVGPARYLFTPLALAVVLAMLASYLLSRTLVPALARMLMAQRAPRRPADATPRAAGPASRTRFNRWRDRHFERFQDALRLGAARRRCTTAGSRCWSRAGIALASLGLATVVGTDFFPSVDAGLMKLHFRAPTGTRIEETEQLRRAGRDRIRGIDPGRASSRPSTT